MRPNGSKREQIVRTMENYPVLDVLVPDPSSARIVLMTAIAAVKFVGGCVLAVDGRATAGCTIYSDRTPKWVSLPLAGAALTGTLAHCQATIRSWLANECETVDEMVSTRVGKDWSAVIYDRSFDNLFVLDYDGTVLEYDISAVHGSGADTAYGYVAGALPSGRRAKTAREARKVILGAIRSAATRDATVGGQVTFLTMSRSGTRLSASRC